MEQPLEANGICRSSRAMGHPQPVSPFLFAEDFGLVPPVNVGFKCSSRERRMTGGHVRFPVVNSFVSVALRPFMDLASRFAVPSLIAQTFYGEVEHFAQEAHRLAVGNSCRKYPARQSSSY